MSEGVVHIPNEAEAWPHVEAWSRMDEIAVVFDCPHTTPTLTDHGPYVVRSQDIRGRRFDMSSAGRVSMNTYLERIARATPEYGDLLYSREGTYFGISAPVPRGERVCLGQRMTLLRPDPARVDHIYLNYWLNSHLMERFLDGFRDGSVAQRLNMSTIRGLPVPILPISEQRQIARTLQVLDDKIELNRRISESLEEMARALYRSWFVDFDPVHSRALGQSPAHMDATTAALFPDNFSPDGLPKGWEMSTIGEVAETVGGATPMTKEPAFWDGPHRWATPRDLSKLGQPILFETDRTLTDAGLAKVSSGLSPAGSVLLSSRAPIGYVAITQNPVAVNQGFIVLRETAQISTVEAYFWVQSNMDAILANANGSTFQEISKKNFRPLPCVVAPDPVRNAFRELAGTWFDRVAGLCAENSNLAALRDTLLPRLMSGDLRIREAEQQVEEVV